MAKKSVATLQTGSKRLTKAIKMVKSPKTGAYTFVEAVMAPEMVGEFLDKKYRIEENRSIEVKMLSLFNLIIH